VEALKICPRCSEGEDASLLVSPLALDEATSCPHCGGDLKRSTDPYLGRTIAARYRLIKRLGAGGMSSVYLARHVIIERLSAIKILRQELGMNPAHRERFLREARAVNRINHDNIVEITDYGESDSVTYLVMEYVQGETLLSHLQRGAFPWARAARVTLQIAGALARAHQAGVIHRDLKPENVLLLDKEGKDFVKLTDFGIAKIEGAPALTFNEQLFGTPGYISPEYVESGKLSPASDLYSLGVVFYEMLTAKLPYDARGQADLMFMPLSKPPIPPGQRVAGIPPEIEALVLRMLARLPEDRPPDAYAVCDVLSETLRGLGGRSSHPPASGVHAERDASPTMVDASSAPPLMSAGNLPRAPTLAMASRWHPALASLNASIERARKRGGESASNAERAAALVEEASLLVVTLERASRGTADLQASLDRISASGRAFRANLGRAIDVLVHDRSRERAHLEALSGTGMQEEEERARAVVDDLSFQIETLQAQLEAKNEEHERALVENAGGLEGSIQGLRVLSAQIVRVIDDAKSLVGTGS
jgi:serine/threonine-protein kinase